MWNGFKRLRIGSSGDSSNGPLGSIKIRFCFGQLNNFQILKKYSSPGTLLNSI
jgi:hypothetical protein